MMMKQHSFTASADPTTAAPPQAARWITFLEETLRHGLMKTLLYNKCNTLLLLILTKISLSTYHRSLRVGIVRFDG